MTKTKKPKEIQAKKKEVKTTMQDNIDDMKLNEAEKKLLKAMRELQETEITGLLKDIYVGNDQVQRDFDQLRWNVRLKVQKVRELMLAIKQNNRQIEAGEIWRIVEGAHKTNPVYMTEDELLAEDRRMRLQIDSEIAGASSTLASMIKYVGNLRMDKKIIVTAEEMEEIIEETDKELKKLCGKGIL